MKDLVPSVGDGVEGSSRPPSPTVPLTPDSANALPGLFPITASVRAMLRTRSLTAPGVEAFSHPARSQMLLQKSTLKKTGIEPESGGKRRWRRQALPFSYSAFGICAGVRMSSRRRGSQPFGNASCPPAGTWRGRAGGARPRPRPPAARPRRPGSARSATPAPGSPAVSLAWASPRQGAPRGSVTGRSLPGDLQRLLGPAGRPVPAPPAPAFPRPARARPGRAAWDSGSDAPPAPWTPPRPRSGPRPGAPRVRA